MRSWWWLALPLALYVCWLSARMRGLGASRSLRKPAPRARAPLPTPSSIIPFSSVVNVLADPSPPPHWGAGRPKANAGVRSHPGEAGATEARALAVELLDEPPQRVRGVLFDVGALGQVLAILRQWAVGSGQSRQWAVRVRAIPTVWLSPLSSSGLSTALWLGLGLGLSTAHCLLFSTLAVCPDCLP
jgi:hypothetical protein